MPLLLLSVQLYHGADEALVGGDAEQSLRVRLRIDGVPTIRDEEQSGIAGVKKLMSV